MVALPMVALPMVALRLLSMISSIALVTAVLVGGRLCPRGRCC